MDVNRWSTTAADNATADPDINFQEGQLPSTVNNSARATMAALKKYILDVSGSITTAGTGSAYTLATQTDLASLTDGLKVMFIAHAASGAAPTLAVDGLTAKAMLRANGDAILSSDIRIGDIVVATYLSGSDKWRCQSIGSFARVTSTGGQVSFSGAYVATITLAGATTVTLPTTGTLATLAGTETLTNKTLPGAAISGTFTGGATWAGQQIFSATGAAQGVFSGYNSATGVAHALSGEIRIGAGPSLQGVISYDGSTTGILYITNIYNSSSGRIEFGVKNRAAIPLVLDDAQIVPGADNTIANGSGTKRWTVVYAATGTINTSNVEEKLLATKKEADDFRPYLRAALNTPLVPFKWQEAAARKGADRARWHFGPTAQGFAQACLDQNVDPRKCAVYCEDPAVRTVEKTRIVSRKIEQEAEGDDEVFEEVEETYLAEEIIEGKFQLGLRLDQFTMLRAHAQQLRDAGEL